MAQKTWGPGSFSALLCLIGVLFCCNLPGGFCLGDWLLNLFGFPAWSNGNLGLHYPPYLALVFFVPAAVLGWRFSTHLLASWGKWVATLILVFLLVNLLFLAS